MGNPFFSDIAAIRERARRHIEKGAVTESFKADPQIVLQLLGEALATEIVCVLRYKRHYYTAKGIHARPVAEKFKEHAANEQEHVDEIAERIMQLGGSPDFSPRALGASHTEYRTGDSLKRMIEEDLVAERVVIETYGEIIRYLKDGDPTTRRMMEKILADEEEHAEDMANLLAGFQGEAADLQAGNGHKKAAKIQGSSPS